MTWVANIIITLGAIFLLGVGIYLAVQDKTATAGTALGFAALFVVLLLLAKFKHVKAFGFEAEMWEQKQVEAAALVDKLTALATLTSEQVALISAKLGLWSGALTNPEMVALMKQAGAVMQSTEVPENRRDEILAPIRDRVLMNYWGAAFRITEISFGKELEQLGEKLGRAVEPERGELVSTINRINQALGKLRTELTYPKFKENPSLEPILSLAKSHLGNHDRLIRELTELQNDLVAFQQNRELRRNIDISSSIYGQFT